MFFSHVTQTTQWTHPVSKIDHKAGPKSNPTEPKKSGTAPSYSKYKSGESGHSSIEYTIGATAAAIL